MRPLLYPLLRLIFSFLHRSPAAHFSIRFLLTVLPERLTPKRGFRCYTPRMASFFFSHGRLLTSCVTSYTAFFPSVLVFLLGTLLGLCAGYTLI